MPPAAEEFVVSWPALWVVPAWIEAHCPIPDGFHKGKPFELADWQLWCTLNHYRLRPGALPAGSMRDDGTEVSASSAFTYRRSQIVGPQKCGKGPWAATIVAAHGPLPHFCGPTICERRLTKAGARIGCSGTQRASGCTR